MDLIAKRYDFSKIKNICLLGDGGSWVKSGANELCLETNNCVRFYYRGKTPTLYNNEGIKLKKYCDKVHIPTPVFLLFDEELIYLEKF